MADLSEYIDVDPNTVVASTGTPEPVPPGDYCLECIDNELRPTRDNTGMVLSCTLKIIEGEYEGQRIFTNFNVRNKKPLAQTIGLAELKALSIACGMDFSQVVADTSVLVGIPFHAKIGMQKTTPEYPEPRNEVKKYYPASNAPAPQQAAPAAKPQAAPPRAAAPATGQRAGLSWMNKKAG